MIDWLKTEWCRLISPYVDASLIEELWTEIKTKYTSKNRYYHDLSHIYNMLLKAEGIKNDIQDLEAFKLAIWYHDIIYKPNKKDNEAKSADFAQKQLKAFHFDKKRIGIVVNLILSTKKHQLLLKENKDNAYLLDLDLSILGTDWEVYKTYITNIRKEYKIYPDFIYNLGRKKVLHHFLQRESLYFTEVFENKYEKQARENLKKEIELL